MSITEDAYSEKMRLLAQKLLERLETLVENGELDQAAIKQICATMKDLRELIRPEQKDNGGVTVILEGNLDQMSR